MRVLRKLGLSGKWSPEGGDYVTWGGLRDRIRNLGGEASDSSGAWGTWAQIVQGTMNLFGDKSALKALKEGEEHGLKDYEEGIDDVDASSAGALANDNDPSPSARFDGLSRHRGRQRRGRQGDGGADHRAAADTGARAGGHRRRPRARSGSA